MPDQNLFSLLDERFAKNPSLPAFRSPEGHVLLTYGELRNAVTKYANALVVLGVEPSDRVTVQVEKSVGSVILYLAALKCGGVFHPLNTAYTMAETEYFVSNARPKVIVCDPSRHRAMRELGDRFQVATVVNLDGKASGTLSELAERMDDRHDTVERSPDDLASLVYTSGTTGRSKGAMITHGNLSSNALTLNRLWNFEQSDRLVHALPIYHVHGLFVALNVAFLSACEIAWFNKFDVDLLIATLPISTVLMGVPTFYTRLLVSPAFTRDVCRNMRLFISGSAPLPDETHKLFADRTGHHILERYGMTETGMIASNPYRGLRLAGTVGFALPEVSVRISETDSNGLGVISVKGPNVFKGYWGMPEKIRVDFSDDGYFNTGDVGKMDEEGRVTISGRAKDLIISGGLNVYPKEVETELDSLPGVGESAVIGISHPDFGESVVAVITADSELQPEGELIAMLARRLARFKLPKRIFVVDELPRNAMGKVQKVELRKRYANVFMKI